jgi:hypothetical protein
MANPNIVSVTTINGKTDATQLTTSLTNILDNSAGSSEVYKVNSIIAANTSSSITVGVDVAFLDSDNTAYYVIKNLDIPPDASLIALDKNTQLYIEENRTLQAKASSGALIDLVISYEVIS